MINIQIKTSFFVCVFCKNVGQKYCTKIVQLFSNIFSKANEKIGLFHPIVFICLNFIGVGGDENLKNIWHGLLLLDDFPTKNIRFNMILIKLDILLSCINLC